MRTSLSKYYNNMVASQEAESMEQLQQDYQSGDLSDMALAVEARKDEISTDLYQLIHVSNEALSLDSDAFEVGEVQQRLENIKLSIESINQSGGFDEQALKWTRIAYESILTPIGLDKDLVTIESDESDKVRISVEGINETIAVIHEVRGSIEAKSIDAIMQVMESLKSTMPEIKSRACALKDSMAHVDYNQDAAIRVSDSITKCLAVNGVLPTGFSQYFASYKDFVYTVMGKYAEQAYESASKTIKIAECMGSLGPDDCPINAMAAVVKEIGDPRCVLSPDDLNRYLPGSGPLFGMSTSIVDEVEQQAEQGEEAPVDESPVEEPDPEMPADTEGSTEVKSTESIEDELTGGPVDELIACLERFVNNNAPVSPLAWNDRTEDSTGTTEVQVLSKETICCSLDCLVEAFDSIDIKVYGERHTDIWNTARSAFSTFKQSLNNLTPSQIATLRPAFKSISDYADMVFALSTWPALHMLVNMVVSANAFVLLAEQSITGESAPMPADTTEEEPEEAPVEEAPVDEEVVEEVMEKETSEGDDSKELADDSVEEESEDEEGLEEEPEV